MDMDDDDDEMDEEAERIIQDIEFKAGGGGGMNKLKGNMNQTKNTEDFENDLAELKQL